MKVIQYILLLGLILISSCKNPIALEHNGPPVFKKVLVTDSRLLSVLDSIATCEDGGRFVHWIDVEQPARNSLTRFISIEAFPYELSRLRDGDYGFCGITCIKNKYFLLKGEEPDLFTYLPDKVRVKFPEDETSSVIYEDFDRMVLLLYDKISLYKLIERSNPIGFNKTKIGRDTVINGNPYIIRDYYGDTIFETNYAKIDDNYVKRVKYLFDGSETDALLLASRKVTIKKERWWKIDNDEAECYIFHDPDRGVRRNHILLSNKKHWRKKIKQIRPILDTITIPPHGIVILPVPVYVERDDKN